MELSGHSSQHYGRYHGETWHTPKGRAIREVVFGMNDGLITTLGFLAGISSAIAHGGVIVLAGLVEVIAGALSMAFGAYLSTKAQREYFQQEIARERREIEEVPEHEREEVAEIYRDTTSTMSWCRMCSKASKSKKVGASHSICAKVTDGPMGIRLRRKIFDITGRISPATMSWRNSARLR